MSKVLRKRRFLRQAEQEKKNARLVHERIRRLKGEDSRYGNYSLDITVYDRKIKLIRLTDAQYSALEKHVLVMEPNPFYGGFFIKVDDGVSLAQIYATFKNLVWCFL